MPRRRRDPERPPIVLARDMRTYITMALDAGDFALARRCLDALERITAGDDAGVTAAEAIVDGVAMPADEAG